MRRVIVHADDFGSSTHFNNAIIKAHKEGFLSSTAVITNGKAFESGINRLKKECPEIGVGVHLNLVEGSSELVTKENFFKIYKDGLYNLSFIKILLYSFNKKFLKQVELEFRNQIETAQEHIKIDHLNSHQHCAAIPKVFEICCRLASEYGIESIRVPREKIILTEQGFKHFRLTFHINIIKFLILRLFSIFNSSSLKKYKLRTTSYFSGVLYTGFVDESVIKKTIKKLNPNESIEILLHPVDLSGSCIGEFAEDSRDYAVTYDRIDELRLLLDSELKEFIFSNSDLVTYRQLSSSSLNSPNQITRRKEISENTRQLDVFVVFDETTFFHPNLLDKLINEVDSINWVGALRVDLPGGGALQAYMLKKWRQLGFINLAGLAIKTFLFKFAGILPKSIKGNFLSSVKMSLEKNNITYRTITKIDESVLDFIKSKNPDVILSSNSLIFPKELLDIPKICSINRHSSLLPSYGGILPVFRSIQYKEKYCGASVHIMEEGIDTGKVLSRKFLPIKNDDSVFKLYEMLFVLSFTAIKESLDKVRNGTHATESLKIQGNLQKSYYSFPKDEDWNEFKENGGKFI